MENEKDKALWEQAKKRVGFKKHLTNYLIINAFIWIVWLLTSDNYTQGFPYPVYATLGWGIGIAFHYFHAYGSNSEDAITKEYNKLKKNQS